MRAKHLTAKQAASELRGILWLVGSLAFALLFPKVSRAGEYSAEQWAALVRNGELSSRAVQGDLSQEEKWGVLEATLVFPAFAVPGSAFEKEFKEQEAAHRKIDPKFFKDEWWPLMLAADVGKVLNIGPNQEVLNLFKDALANSPGGKQSQAKLAAVRSLVIPAAGAQPTPYASAATDSNVREYRARAAQGDAIAQYSLGACYWNGQGVDRNFVEAAKWFRKAADQGNTLAQSALGYFYYAGEGVEQNYAKAVQWWRRAAEQGDATAQFNIGDSYAKGEGVEQNFVTAAKWYRKAADQNYAHAQSALGLCYAKGVGVEKSPTEAAKCYRKLASCYANGLGVEKNPIEADQWRRNAAEQEDAAKATVGAPTSAIPIPVEETPKTRADTPADRTPNPSEETATTGAGVPVIATPKPPSDLRAFVVLLWGLLSGLV